LVACYWYVLSVTFTLLGPLLFLAAFGLLLRWLGSRRR